MRNILKRITAPVRGLHQAAYLLAGLTLVSQILALLRDHIFANAFGAGQVLDMYYAAFNIPNVVFALVGSLVSAYVLIPKLTNLDTEKARELISQTCSFFVITAGIISVGLAVFAPQILFAIYPTFRHAPQAGQFVLLNRILLLQPILLGVSGIVMGVTQIHRKFFLFALSPVLYNVGIIFGAVLLYPVMGLPGIGIGVVGGAVAYLLIHLPVLAEAHMFPKPVWPSVKEMWLVVKDSVPRSLALGMSSITTLALLAIASRAGTGDISIFTLANNLASVPLALVASSYVTAAFPVMAEHVNKQRLDEYKSTIVIAGRHIIYLSAIITVLAIVLRAHIVRIILGSGQFNWDNTRIAAAVLAILVFSLIAQGIILLASRAFYAAHRSWNPLIVQLGDAGVSVFTAWGALHLSQVWPAFRYFVEALFRVSDVPGTSVLFIAIGATIGQLAMCIVALITFRTVAPGVARAFTRPVFVSVGAAILGGGAAYVVLLALGNIAPLTSTIAVFTQGLLAGIVGLAVSAVILSLLEPQEFKSVYASLRKMRNFRSLMPSGPTISETGE